MGILLNNGNCLTCGKELKAYQPPDGGFLSVAKLLPEREMYPELGRDGSRRVSSAHFCDEDCLEGFDWSKMNWKVDDHGKIIH